MQEERESVVRRMGEGEGKCAEGCFCLLPPLSKSGSGNINSLWHEHANLLHSHAQLFRPPMSFLFFHYDSKAFISCTSQFLNISKLPFSNYMFLFPQQSTPQESFPYKRNDSSSPGTFSPNFYETFVLQTTLSRRGIVGTVFRTGIKSFTKKVILKHKLSSRIGYQQYIKYASRIPIPEMCVFAPEHAIWNTDSVL